MLYTHSHFPSNLPLAEYVRTKTRRFSDGRMAEYGGGGDCCRCCSSFILTSGLTALFLWLSLRTSKPTCSIEKFYVPALNRSDNSTTNNHTIYFDLKLDNGMKDKGVRYANISLNFFYNSSLLPIANYTVPGFYQGHKKNTHRRDGVEAAGLPWAAAMEAVSNRSTASFRVKLVTKVKFKIMFWYTKRESLDVGGDVVVDDTGNKVHKKNIKLKSAAPGRAGNWVGVGPLVILTLLVTLLFSCN